MEPCLFRHGKQAISETGQGVPNAASMEPCLFRHGKITTHGSNFLRRMRLQWSHVFSDMVREIDNKFYEYDGELQWSHVFSDMVSP